MCPHLAAAQRFALWSGKHRYVPQAKLFSSASRWEIEIGNKSLNYYSNSRVWACLLTCKCRKIATAFMSFLRFHFPPSGSTKEAIAEKWFLDKCWKWLHLPWNYMVLSKKTGNLFLEMWRNWPCHCSQWFPTCIPSIENVFVWWPKGDTFASW